MTARSERRKISIDFNAKFQPIGVKAKDLIGYVGVLARTLFINYEEWPMVL